METIGQKFLCTRTVILGTDVYYIEGKIYKSEVTGCITNEGGNKEHEWGIDDEEETYWTHFFKQWRGNKRKSASKR